MNNLRFMHIPKTAGSTLTAILKRQYGNNHFAFEGDIYRDTKRFYKLSENVQTNLNVITGHVPMVTSIGIIDAMPVITLLRDPVDRVKSYCQHVFEGKSTYLNGKFTKADFNLDKFLMYDIGNLENIQTRFLLSHEHIMTVDKFRELSASEAKQRALHSLFKKLDCYGIQDKFDETLVLFKHRLGWEKPILYASKNVKDKKCQIEFKKRHIERIEKLNRVDTTVYQEAKEHFLRQITNSLQEEVTCFKKLNNKVLEPFMGQIDQMRSAYTKYIKETKPKSIYIWGTSGYYHQLSDIFSGVIISAFIDNDPLKRGKILDGVPIISPTALRYKDVKPIIICSNFKEDITIQILTELPQFSNIP